MKINMQRRPRKFRKTRVRSRMNAGLPDIKIYQKLSEIKVCKWSMPRPISGKEIPETDLNEYGNLVNDKDNTSKQTEKCLTF